MEQSPISRRAGAVNNIRYQIITNGLYTEEENEIISHYFTLYINDGDRQPLLNNFGFNLN
jgi:hypothetical protein